MEKVCRLVKFMLRATRLDFPVLQPLLHLIIQLFPVAPWSCFIYTCSLTVDEFSRYISPIIIYFLYNYNVTMFSVAEHRDLFAHTLNAIATKSLTILSSAEQITEHPTVCEDFFNFLSRCISDLTTVSLQSGVLQLSIACAVHALRIQHREAARAVFMFLRHWLDLGQTRAECQGLY